MIPHPSPLPVTHDGIEREPSNGVERDGQAILGMNVSNGGDPPQCGYRPDRRVSTPLASTELCVRFLGGFLQQERTVC